MNEMNITKIEKMIYVIRGHKVMLDSDLAELYEVETKVLNRQAIRHENRFPPDFMFRLTHEEYESLICQIGISNEGHGGRRKLPLVFTEGGVAMLSSVLQSERAAMINISIIRTFIRLRSFLSLDAAENTLNEKIDRLEQGTKRTFKRVFERLDAIEEDQPTYKPNRRKIGLNKT